MWECSYHLAKDAYFCLVESDVIEGVAGTGSVRMTLMHYAILLKFKRTNSAIQVYHSLGSSLSMSAFQAHLRACLDSGILTECVEPNPSELQHDWFGTMLNPDAFSQLNIGDSTSPLAPGQLLVLTNAFRSSFAEDVFTALDCADTWEPLESYRHPNFQYRHRLLRSPYLDRGLEPIRECVRIFTHEKTRSLVSDLSLRDCSAPPQFSTTWHLPGDYSLPHTDAGQNRTVAFVWHLAKRWEPSWGGSLYWCPTNDFLNTNFNTLSIFVVSPEHKHFVSTVTPYAREKRFAIAGWWRSSTTVDSRFSQPYK
jgi:hypothetical protein